MRKEHLSEATSHQVHIGNLHTNTHQRQSKSWRTRRFALGVYVHIDIASGPYSLDGCQPACTARMRGNPLSASRRLRRDSSRTDGRPRRPPTQPFQKKKKKVNLASVCRNVPMQ
jgi:hypothetical protein